MKTRKKICFVTAIPLTIEVFLVDYIRSMETLYDVTVITNAEDINFLGSYGLNTRVIKIPIERNISLLHDLVALHQLFTTFRYNKFFSVHSVTPKAGLLTMTASWLAKTPVRIHTFTGQVWANKTGIKRKFLKAMDRFTVLFATHVLADSKSQREFIIKEGVSDPQKIGIIGHGSISGVDTERFSPDAEARREIRQKLKIENDAPVFLFLGRLNREKGIFDLYEAFEKIAGFYKKAHLIIVGPDEENIMKDIEKKATALKERIHYEGITRTPELYMKASDCLCLPSYREGFGLAIIEAAACGIPAIGSRIYGIVDAIEENVTGLLHAPGNVNELYHHMEWMILHPEERQLMGAGARERAKKLFAKEKMIPAFLDFYQKVIG